MFRLPVCPHCGTVYRYQDTKKIWKRKESTCYHCQKRFRIKKAPGVPAEALVLTALCIGFNILMLNRMSKMNLVVLFAATTVFLLLIYLLIPFFVRFVRIDDRNIPKKSQQKLQQNKEKSTNSSMNKQKQQQSNKKRRSQRGE